MFKRIALSAVLMAPLGMLAGCSSTPKDLTTQKLAPIPVSEVKFYQSKPKHYDIVAMIVMPITPDITWVEHGQADAAFDALKAKAAEVGANGVLLDLDKTQYEWLVGLYYHGDSLEVPMHKSDDKKYAVAQAILVKD